MTIANNMQISFSTPPSSTLTDLIKKECQDCKINKIYTAVRSDKQAEPFKVTALIEGKEVVILEGDQKDYHMELLTDVVGKYFYNLDFDGFKGKMTPEVFNFVRRIPPDEWKQLMETIKSVREPQQEDLDAFNKGNWKHAVFKEEEWPALALKSYFQGKITQDRVVLLLLYDMSKDCSLFGRLPEVHELMQDGKLNPEAKKLVEHFFLRMAWNAIEKTPTDFGMPFKQEDWELLEQLMKDWPPEDSQFLTFEAFCLYRFDPEKDPFYKPLIKPIHSELHPFIAGTTTVILPTKVINAVLNAKYGKNAMKQNPVLGYSQRDDFAHKTKRDALIPCRYLSLPPKLHGTEMSRNLAINFYHHDNAHQLQESSNKDRPLLLKLAAELDKKGLKDTLNYVLDRFINLENESTYFLQQIAQEKDAAESLPLVVEFMLNSEYRDIFKQTIQSPDFQKTLVDNKIDPKAIEKIALLVVDESNLA